MESVLRKLFVLLLVLTFGVAISYAQDSAALYKSKCQACHGASGKGDTPMGPKLGVKDFHSPEVAKASDQDLFNTTKNGKNKMPAYGKQLSDDQIKGLVKYIRALK